MGLSMLPSGRCGLDRLGPSRLVRRAGLVSEPDGVQVVAAEPTSEALVRFWHQDVGSRPGPRAAPPISASTAL
jgi:hypothetical protein